MSSRILLGILLGAALLPVPAVAQESGASLAGRVVLEGGGRIEMELVLVDSARGVQRRRAPTTDGSFLFPVLPAGTYSLRLVRIGMSPRSVDGIMLRAGERLVLRDIVVQERPVDLVPVRVSAPSLHLDGASPASRVIFTPADFALLPGERTYTALLSTVPHATPSPRNDPVNFLGATGLENVLLIDGANVTNPLTGASAMRLPATLAQSVTVKTGGMGPQDGRALGAIVQMSTISGSNDFALSVSSRVAVPALGARARPLPTTVVHDTREHDAAVQLSGPLVPNRLWYLAAYNPLIVRSRVDVGALGRQEDRETAHLFGAKVNWQPASETMLEMSVFGDPATRDAVDAVRFGNALPLALDPVLRDVRSGGVLASARLATAIVDRVSFEVAASQYRGDDVNRAATPAGRDLSLLRDETNPGSVTLTGGVGYQSRTSLERSSLRTQWAVSGRSSVTRIGGELETLRAVRDHVQSGGYQITRGPAAWSTLVDIGSGRFRNRAPAAFVEHSQTLPHGVIATAGVRWSSQALAGTSGRTAQRFPNEWQPRVGIVWTDGLQRTYASAGRYYQQLPLNLASFWYVDWYYIEATYDVDPRTPGAAPVSTLDESSAESDWARHIEGVRAEHSDEYSVGYDRLFARGRTKVGLRGVRRSLRSSFQWARGPAGFVLGTAGQGDLAFLPRARREYQAVEATVEGSVSRVTYRASYVHSSNTGNYTGLATQDLGVNSPGGNFTLFFPVHATNTTGRLPNDRPHAFKLAAAYQNLRGFDVGLIGSIQSGAPMNVIEEVGQRRRFVVPRGTFGRTPATWVVDMRISRDLMRRSGGQSRLMVDLYNLGNPQRATWLHEVAYEAAPGGAIRFNPAFGTARAFQAPMQVRLGIEVNAR